MTEALDMCLKHNVTITEELAEKLTPTIPENGNSNLNIIK